MERQAHFITFLQLSQAQQQQYRAIIKNAFPRIVLESKVTEKYWPRLERYFPEYQVYLIHESGEIIGFINSIPFHWNKALETLPDDGWDWMLQEGVENNEQGVKSNCIGGLQIIVNPKYLGQGYSRKIIAEAKILRKQHGLEHLLIPIRPTLKHHFPHMKMEDYIHYKENEKLYDPWIRNHLRNGAEIIKVCHNAMNVTREIPYWESLLNRKIETSGHYLIEGALNPIMMDLDKNIGEYREANIWIKYD